MPSQNSEISQNWLLPLLKLRVWIFDHIRPSELQITLFWAGVIGFVGAVSSVVFRMLSRQLQFLFTHQHAGFVASFFPSFTMAAFARPGDWRRHRGIDHPLWHAPESAQKQHRLHGGYRAGKRRGARASEFREMPLGDVLHFVRRAPSDAKARWSSFPPCSPL